MKYNMDWIVVIVFILILWLMIAQSQQEAKYIQSSDTTHVEPLREN